MNDWWLDSPSAATPTHSHITQVQVKMALTVENFADVQFALWEARSHWFNIGVRLGLKVTDLMAIDHEQGLNLEGKFARMILSWLQCGEKCTWRKLRKALKHCTVNLPELAWQIKTNHGSKESQSCLYLVHICVLLANNIIHW